MTETATEKKEKAPPTPVGTLSRINKLLSAHTADEQAKILAFLTATGK